MASRLHRLLSILEAVKTRKYPTLQQLCDELQVKPRTLFHDLKELRELLGFDIRFSREHGGYYVAKGPVNPNLPEETSILLAAAVELFGGLNGEEMGSSVRQVLRQTLLDSKVSAEDLQAMFKCLAPAAKQVNRNVFLGVCRAILPGQTLAVTTSQRGKSSTRQLTIVPKQLVYSDAGWLVRGDGNPAGESVELNLQEIISIRRDGEK